SKQLGFSRFVPLSKLLVGQCQQPILAADQNLCVLGWSAARSRTTTRLAGWLGGVLLLSGKCGCCARGVRQDRAKVLHDKTSLRCFESGKLHNKFRLLKSVLADEAHCLAKFLTLRSMLTHAVNEPVKMPDHLFSLEHSRVLGLGVIIDDHW